MTIFLMVEFACNRRHNGLALLNSVTFLASGVPQRVHDYLHSLGLTSSSSTANQCMRTLKRETEEILKHRASLNYVFQPLITADNIDIMKRVHHTRVEEKSKIHHGSWAYTHFLPEHLQKEIQPEQATVESFQAAMRASETASIELYKFLPDEAASEHWKSSIKSQIATALIRHVIEKDGPAERYCKKNLAIAPPAINAIPVEKPDVMMFKMTAASDDSAGGVAEMLEQLRIQSGLSEEDYASKIRVVEGDHGTCKNIHSLIAKSFPAEHQDEAHEELLTVLGASHTLWNVSQNVLLKYWGDPKDSSDTGAWKSWVALGGTSEKPVSKKDFSLIMEIVHNIHTATLVFLLQ